MKLKSTLFLKGVVCIMGMLVLALFIFALPRIIGSIDPWGYDPILFGLYLTGIPFFIALWETLKLLGYIEKNTAFSDLSVRALKRIKYSAIAIGTLYAAGMPYIFYVAEQDDAPGVVLIGLIFIGSSFVIAVFAAVLERLLKNAIDIKSENELTV